MAAPKIWSGGLKQLKQANKVVHQYESSDMERCHVLLMDKYMSKLPPEAKSRDLFYLKQKTEIPVDPCAPWYTSKQTGRNGEDDGQRKRPG